MSDDKTEALHLSGKARPRTYDRFDSLTRRLRTLADCDARAGEPLGKCMRESADVIDALRARVAELEAALEIIAGRRQCMDNLRGNRDVAIWALDRNETEPEREPDNRTDNPDNRLDGEREET